MSDEQNEHDEQDEQDIGAGVMVADRIAELEAELAEAQAAREVAEAELAEATRVAELERDRADRLSPTADVSAQVFESADDVTDYFTQQALRDAAGAELESINRNRQRRGAFPVQWSDEDWDRAVADEAAKIVAERRGLVAEAGPLTRVLKFFKPKDRSIVQVPIEPQVNNHKGSLEDSTARYRNKGFKIATVRARRGPDGRLVADKNGPLVTMFCATRDCWELAEINDLDGHPRFEGYCGPDHQRRTEMGKDTGEVTNRQVLAG